MFQLCPPIVADHSAYKCLLLTALPHMNILSSIPLKLQKQEYSDLCVKTVNLKY